LRYTHGAAHELFQPFCKELPVAESVSQQVQVRVPATTANLGCGFDIFGLALQLYNSFTLTRTSKPGWQVQLPAGVSLPTDKTNLVYQAARQLFERVGHIPPGLHLSLATEIPLARGLGSSSSAIVGGLVAANQLTGNTLDKAALLAMAVDIEGHPDNVTPALMGNLTVSYTVLTQHRYLCLAFPPELTLIVAIPDFEIPTARARAVLPAQVSRGDAVFNCSRTALFIYALQNRRYDLLATAMDDQLHQPYRAALVPGMTAAITDAYAAGALGVALSGAGPTLLAITQDHIPTVAAVLRAAFQRHGIACQTRQLHVDTTGAVVV
jgi:homoserine kinase